MEYSVNISAPFPTTTVHRWQTNNCVKKVSTSVSHSQQPAAAKSPQMKKKKKNKMGRNRESVSILVKM